MSKPVSAQPPPEIYANGIDYMENGEYDLAFRTFEYILSYKNSEYLSVICALLSQKFKNAPIDKLLDYQDSDQTDDLLFYWLGIIELRRFNLDESANYLNRFIKLVGENEAYQFQIDDTIKKLDLINRAQDQVKITGFESPINSKLADLPGAIFYDPESFIFMSDRRSEGNFDIYTIQKGDYGWEAPRLKSDEPIVLSQLNVIRVKESIYTFNVQQNGLSEMNYLDLDAPIPSNSIPLNFLSGAHHIYLNKYKNRVVFSKETSDKKLEIYESVQLRSTGEWLDPTPIQGLINSIYNDDYPFITDDRKRLYFSSDRPGGAGKYDIYYCEMNEQTNIWSDPVNVGLPLNSSDNDIYFTLFSEGQGLLSSDRIYSSGDLDIFLVEFKN